MQPGENDSEYRRRMEFVTAFDWFRNESKISEDKEREVLRILGEAQAKIHTIESEGKAALDEGGKRWEAYVHWAPIITTEIASTAEEEVAERLTPHELQAWDRYVSDLARGVHLQYAEPLRIAQ